MIIMCLEFPNTLRIIRDMAVGSHASAHNIHEDSRSGKHASIRYHGSNIRTTLLRAALLSRTYHIRRVAIHRIFCSAHWYVSVSLIVAF